MMRRFLNIRDERSLCGMQRDRFKEQMLFKGEWVTWYLSLLILQIPINW